MGAFQATVKNFWLDALARNVSYANPGVYVKLHLGDPGAAGTANPAANTTRGTASFGVGASGGSIAINANCDWVNVPNTETYTWVSLWNNNAAGTFLASDDLSSSAPVTAGDTFRLPATTGLVFQITD